MWKSCDSSFTSELECPVGSIKSATSKALLPSTKLSNDNIEISRKKYHL